MIKDAQMKKQYNDHQSDLNIPITKNESIVKINPCVTRVSILGVGGISDRIYEIIENNSTEVIVANAQNTKKSLEVLNSK